MPHDTRTIWPAARDPRVIVHADRPFAWAGRWMRRSAHQAHALAVQACQALPQWPNTDVGLLALAYGVLLPPLLAPPPPPVPGEPVLAWVNFVVQIVIMIVAIIIAVALAPKPPQPKPAALADFDAPTAEEGKPYCKVFGEAWVRDPNVLWYGDLASEPIRKKGGKK